MQKLREENRLLKQALTAAVRGRQMAERRAESTKSDHDRRELVQRMAEGAYITFPEDEPALGVTAGETFQKRHGKLARVKTVGGLPVKETSFGGGNPFDFRKANTLRESKEAK
jgi:hypothetical protein